MLKQWLDSGIHNEPVWLSDVRENCAAIPNAAHTVIQLTLPDGRQRDYPLSIPRWSTYEERSLALEYVCACFLIFSRCWEGGGSHFISIRQTERCPIC